jgi:hypothetical protein
MELGFLCKGPTLVVVVCLTLLLCFIHVSSSSLYSELNPIKPRHSRLLRSAVQRETPTSQLSEIWTPLENQGWKSCDESINKPTLPEKSEGYIQVFLDGGLNQQRMGVCI